jgi:hypothetical protein
LIIFLFNIIFLSCSKKNVEKKSNIESIANVGRPLGKDKEEVVISKQFNDFINFIKNDNQNLIIDEKDLKIFGDLYDNFMKLNINKEESNSPNFKKLMRSFLTEDVIERQNIGQEFFLWISYDLEGPAMDIIIDKYMKVLATIGSKQRDDQDYISFFMNSFIGLLLDGTIVLEDILFNNLKKSLTALIKHDYKVNDIKFGHKGEHTLFDKILLQSLNGIDKNDEKRNEKQARYLELLTIMKPNKENILDLIDYIFTKDFKYEEDKLLGDIIYKILVKYVDDNDNISEETKNKIDSIINDSNKETFEKIEGISNELFWAV